MSKSINRTQLLGHLGKDPVIRIVGQDNTKVASFSIATTDSYKNANGEKVEVTDWHNVVAWRGIAEIIEKYIEKGSKVLVEGKNKTRSYDDNNGTKRYVTEVLIDNIILLSNNKNGNQIKEPIETQQNGNNKVESDDDLPF